MDTFGERLKDAMRELARREGVLVVEASELGRRVSARLGRDRDYSSQAVGNWIEGRSEPGLDVIAALAAILGVRAGWLAFREGERTTPASYQPPERDVQAALDRNDAYQKELAARGERARQSKRG